MWFSFRWKTKEFSCPSWYNMFKKQCIRNNVHGLHDDKRRQKKSKWFTDQFNRMKNGNGLLAFVATKIWPNTVCLQTLALEYRCLDTNKSNVICECCSRAEFKWFRSSYSRWNSFIIIGICSWVDAYSVEIQKS